MAKAKDQSKMTNITVEFKMTSKRANDDEGESKLNATMRIKF